MGKQSILTHFAPAVRASAEELVLQRQSLEAVPALQQLLDALPDITVVLNGERQVVAGNRPLLSWLGNCEPESLAGRRPGEILGCVHAEDCDGGCGTSRHCQVCGAVQAMLESQTRGCGVERECRVTVARDGREECLDLKVSVTPLCLSGPGEFYIMVVSDISHEKRRRALERIFFHDVINTAGGLNGLLRFGLENDDLEDLKDALETAAEAADRLMAELEQHRVLLLAENGELKPEWSELNSLEILQEAVDCLSGHAVASGKRLTMDSGSASCAITSDRVLLGRVLVNLLKNGCEASQPGEEIKLGCRENGRGLEFWVNNPAVMPSDVQLQIFNRSFSTKGSDRGLGTYGIKLLSERYLRGRVSFVSRGGLGTEFTVHLPLEPEKQPAP